MSCRTEYQGEPLEMEADTEAEEAEEEMEVHSSVLRQITMPELP